jgi:N6-L-threonylcarbamoyladenine synthase
MAKNGQPLMPTERYGNVRRMLKSGRAAVVKRCPFTIQLTYDSTSHTQEIALGIDAGSKHIGISATTKTKVLYESEVQLRTDIIKLLSDRREQRCSRRNRKTRYRKPRFSNRKRPEGWLAPSVQQKVDCHLKTVSDVCKILPITEIIVETASFDIQKIKHPDISGSGYQQGEQLNFWNVREYVLFRDNHTCQCCHGKSKDNILNVHHIESRKTGGDSPDNLVTLCEYCHKQYHLGKLKLPATIHRGTSYRDAAFMGIMRWAFYEKLKQQYPNVHMTFGYLTKNTRIRNSLPKTHCVDARCISGHPLAEPPAEMFYQRKVRCHNRQLHKCTIGKGGIRKRNQAPYLVKGYRLFDKVSFQGKECFIFARRSSGYFDIRTLDGMKISPCAGYKKLRLLEPRKTILTERRTAIPPTVEAVGFFA